MARDCVLLLGHGSREPTANAEFEALAARYRAARPELRVETAYIELANPSLAAALESLAPQVQRLVIVPLFLFASGHVKNDVPLAIAHARRRFPHVSFAAAPALGAHRELVELAHARAQHALPSDPAEREEALLLVVGRGASDADANAEFCKVARLIAERCELRRLATAFIGISEPRVDAALEQLARLRPERLLVLPYLLFGGRLLSKLEQQIAAYARQYPWIHSALLPHLGVDERLCAVLDERARQALAGQATLPCDNCQYRQAAADVARQAPALRALLYSVRHTFTHSQALLPPHLHKPLKKHVLVCGNADCVDRGSIALLEALRREVKDTRRAAEIKITRTACMGRCGEGPTVAVYPDGVWYQHVAARDARPIVREHLLEDRLVARLVGDILH